jgi:molybdate transport system substrate-binding protein
LKLLLVAVLSLVAAPAAGADLIVSAASSLTNAFTDIGKAYEKGHAGTRVVFNFASSGQLLQQISRGAPVDVFASADEETMDKAAQQNLVVASTRADFCGNRLVLVAPGDFRPAVTRLEDLSGGAVRRIAIGDPATVPAGRYAKAALEAAGLYDALEPKLIRTQNVRQGLDYAARGEVEAAFVYSTDASQMPGRVRTLMEVETTQPVTYPIAAVKGNGKETLAARFVEFVRGPEGQEILKKYGFLPAP